MILFAVKKLAVQIIHIATDKLLSPKYFNFTS